MGKSTYTKMGWPPNQQGNFLVEHLLSVCIISCGQSLALQAMYLLRLLSVSVWHIITLGFNLGELVIYCLHYGKIYAHIDQSTKKNETA